MVRLGRARNCLPLPRLWVRGRDPALSQPWSVKVRWFGIVSIVSPLTWRYFDLGIDVGSDGSDMTSLDDCRSRNRGSGPMKVAASGVR
jgi:hypothetical protein